MFRVKAPEGAHLSRFQASRTRIPCRPDSLSFIDCSRGPRDCSRVPIVGLLRRRVDLSGVYSCLWDALGPSGLQTKVFFVFRFVSGINFVLVVGCLGFWVQGL